MFPSLRKQDQDFMHLTSHSKVLFVTFGGIKQKLGMDVPPFEFVRSIHSKNCDAMFLRDRSQLWYQLGVKGIGDNVQQVAGFLNQKIEEGKYELVVTLGNSMGGYASLLFGSMIESDISIAISPRTFLDAANRSKNNDTRWESRFAELYRLSGSKSTPEFFDLHSYFYSRLSAKNNKPCVRLIMFGAAEALDRVHSIRMSSLKSFYVYEVKEGKHDAARLLHRSGMLDRLIDCIAKCKMHDTSMLLPLLQGELQLKRYEPLENQEIRSVNSL